MNFLPISIIAYALNGGALLVAKIQLQTTLPSPLSYTFYTCILQLLALFLIPFGFDPNVSHPALIYSVLSGIIFVFALYTLFQSMKENEVSVVGPLTGAINPLTAFLIGVLFLNQTLTGTQTIAFLFLIIGALILSANLWAKKSILNQKFAIILLAGFLFGLSYVLLREAFFQTNFITGLVVSRAAAGLFVLPLLIFSKARAQIFTTATSNKSQAKQTGLLFLSGQVMSGTSNFLLFYAVSLANPALVNSVFGVQYLIILIVALFLAKKHPQLLDEDLNRRIIFQKIMGAVIISIGLYLLAK